VKRQQTAKPERPPRAYVSGDAGVAIVVARGETYLLRAQDSRPKACSPVLLANILAFADDIDVYDIATGSPFSRVTADVEQRTRSSRCVDYIVAVLDAKLPGSLRIRAAKAAELLLRDTPGLIEAVKRVFFNVAPPLDADVDGAEDLTRDCSQIHGLVTQIARYSNQIAGLHEQWEQESAMLPTLALRSEAANVMAQKALAAELLLGTYKPSLVLTADPAVREAIAHWVKSALPERAAERPATPAHSGTHASAPRGSIGGRRTPFKLRKLLVIGDDEKLIGYYRELLIPYGFEVLTALDGEGAIPLIENNPDIMLVILDLSMPRMDGREWLQCFRGLRKEAPVIIVSGHKLEVDPDLRPSVVLEKPIHVAELLDIVGLYCGLRTTVAVPKA
jgi:CheY-like chemotaxis protein